MKVSNTKYPPGNIVTAAKEICCKFKLWLVFHSNSRFHVDHFWAFWKKAKEMDVSKLQFDFSLGGYKKLEDECLFM